MQTVENLYEYEGNNNSKLPSGIAVTTIFTFIGAGMQLLGALSKLGSQNCNEVAEQFESQMRTDQFAEVLTKFPKMEGMMDGMSQFAVMACENHLLISLVAAACAIACIVGGVFMRRRRKLGYTLYMAGLIVYPVVMIVLLGSNPVTGIMAVYYMFAPVLFGLIYTMQRRHLIY